MIKKQVTQSGGQHSAKECVIRKADVFRCLCLLQGSLLFLAAGAKLWMLFTDPFADLRTGFSLPVLWVAVVVESVAAWYLIRRHDPTGQWLVMAGLFTSFLVISIARFVLGYVGCGCLGQLSAPRWLLPLNNSLVLAALLVILAANRELFRFQQFPGSAISRLRDPVVVGRCLALLILAIITFLVPVFQSAGTSDLFGKPGLANVTQTANDLRVGEAAEIDVSIPNHTNKHAVLIGSQTSCNCVVVAEQRQTFAAASSSNIKVRVRPRKPGFFHQRIVCFIDHPDQDRLMVDVYGNVLGKD